MCSFLADLLGNVAKKKKKKKKFIKAAAIKLF